MFARQESTILRHGKPVLSCSSGKIRSGMLKWFRYLRFHIWIVVLNACFDGLDFKKVKVLIDETSLGFIEGSKLDFVEDIIGSYFKITNPNATSTCGCGTSFSL